MTSRVENSGLIGSDSNTSYREILYHAIIVAFCVIVVVSNIISAKLIKLPVYDLSIPAGLITYPLTFLMSDFVTEIFGVRKAKIMIYITLAMNLLAFGIIEIALLLPAVDEIASREFQAILGLSGLRIFASLVGYIFSQITDVQLYALIKSWTGSKFLWLRNNGSSCLSQLVDTILIDIIYLYLGLQMSMTAVIPIMMISYLYKMFFSVACTPLFYLSVYLATSTFGVRRLVAYASS